MSIPLPTLSTSRARISLHPIHISSSNSFRQCRLYLCKSSVTSNLESKKYELLKSVQETQRGTAATSDQRFHIEESLVNLEEFGAGEQVDLGVLDGTWRLNYTSASDVLVLFDAAARLPFFKVGQIFQKFECKGGTNGGIVRNVVRWSVANVLEEQDGATLLVTAKFSVLTKRNIYLHFDEGSLDEKMPRGAAMVRGEREEAFLEDTGDLTRNSGVERSKDSFSRHKARENTHGSEKEKRVAVENIKISDELQALIAPAILPRSFLSLQILQFLRTFRAQLPLSGPNEKSPGALYYLSYLDRDMLCGRAIGGGGVFVFTRAQPLV